MTAQDDNDPVDANYSTTEKMFLLFCFFCLYETRTVVHHKGGVVGSHIILHLRQQLIADKRSLATAVIKSFARESAKQTDSQNMDKSKTQRCVTSNRPVMYR